MTYIEELIENGDTQIRYTKDITHPANITQWTRLAFSLQSNYNALLKPRNKIKCIICYVSISMH